MVAILLGDRFAIEQDFTALRRVEAGNDFGKGGFAAAVSANQENNFARAKSRGDRPEFEPGIVLLAVVGMRDATQLKPMEARGRAIFGDGAPVGGVRRER